MKIGFTGTRKGMTPLQKQSVAQLLIVLTHPHANDEFRHGACVGADVEAHKLAYELTQARIYVHPSTAKTRVYDLEGVHHTYPAKPPLERDHDIVTNTDILLAAPSSFRELRRSGTWTTVRYARQAGRTVYVVWPDGRWERVTA